MSDVCERRVRVKRMPSFPEASCTGCGACFAACAKRALTMREDAEGFLRPHLDAARCVSCGRCLAACPLDVSKVASSARADGGPDCAASLFPPRRPLAVYAANAHDDALRLASSSSGVFTLLARSFLASGVRRGVDGAAECGPLVVGAAYDLADWSVRHVAVAAASDLACLRGSKYVQSRLDDCFLQVRDALRAGRRVMFVGTPCQIAGLRRFLVLSQMPKAVPDLLLVSLICHSVPSPLAWRAFLREQGERFETVRFRDKTNGWKAYRLTVVPKDGKGACAHILDDAPRAYLDAFLSDWSTRRSCLDCHFRSLRDGADLTLGDYWNVASRFPELDDDRGTSLVLVNTPRGAEAFDAIRSQLTIRESDFSHACEVNPALVQSPKLSPKREKFFRLLPRKGFSQTIRILRRPPLRLRLKSLLARLARKLRRGCN